MTSNAQTSNAHAFNASRRRSSDHGLLDHRRSSLQLPHLRQEWKARRQAIISQMSLVNEGSGEFIKHKEEDIQRSRRSRRNASRPSFSNPKNMYSDPASSYNTTHDDFDIRKRPYAKSETSVPGDSGNSWEWWWIHSLFWKRGIVLMVFMFAIIGIVQFIFTLKFFLAFNKDKVVDPYVCKTDNCLALSRWLSQSRNMSVSPCENFYDFVCGKHSQKDKGKLRKQWYRNIARLEADGESIIAQILKKNSDPIAVNTIKYYQSCVDKKRKMKRGLDLYITLIKTIFDGFDLWNNDATPTLEEIAIRMIHRVGDYGFFSIEVPISHPYLYLRPLNHIKPDEREDSRFNEENLGKFLPMIYDALNIDVAEREIVTTNLFRMTALLGNILKHGKPECSQDTKLDHYFDLQYPIWEVYLGSEFIEKDPITKRWKLKNKDDMIMTLFPNLDSFHRYIKTFKHLKDCWNPLAQKIPVKYIRAVYATFWSVRLLVEVVPGLVEETIKEYGIDKNNIFEDFLTSSYKRSQQTRCLETLLKTMGYTPIFRYFLNKDLPVLIQEVNKVVNQTASALLKNWLPPEEGGLPYISSRYRQRVNIILSGEEDTSVLFAVREDNHLQNFKMPSETSPDHLVNAGAWRIYTQNRTFDFWKSKTPKDRLVWHKEFYGVEDVNAFETPAYAAYNLLKLPTSMFMRPFWENDFMLANYAGAYNLVTKAWLNLLVFDYSEGNFEQDMLALESRKHLYREGVMSDGIFTPCETYAYDWKYDNLQNFTSETVDPHSHAFKYGARIGAWGEFINAVFPLLLSTKTAYELFFERIDGLLKAPFKTLTTEEKKYLMNRKLVNHEQYSEKQLFFMLAMRDTCRAKSDDDDAFQHHVTDNIVTMMNSKAFAEAWNCPIGSPMNPVNKCFANSPDSDGQQK